MPEHFADGFAFAEGDGPLRAVAERRVQAVCRRAYGECADGQRAAGEQPYGDRAESQYTTGGGLPPPFCAFKM